MKLAYAYKRKGRIYIHSWSKTRDGMWIGDGRCTVLPLTSAAEDLGLAVNGALAQSRKGVSHPSPEGWKEVIRPLLDAAGVKSWPTFSKLASAVSIELEAERLRLQPMGRDSAGAYFGVADRDVRLPSNASLTDIGEALMEAFAAAD